MKTRYAKPDTKTSHTPTPWVVKADSPDMIHQVKGLGYIAKVAGGTDQEAYANTALIVRAVNSHEELVDLVKELYEYCGSRLNNAACIRIEEAIAQAESK